MPASTRITREMKTDVLIVGGGIGGISAALSAAEMGADVVLAEELDWLGGQLTAQGVPLDEYPWNETVIFSRSYAQFRAQIRGFYRVHYPLAPAARANPLLNPGMGNVSTLCHEPRVSVQVIEAMLAPHQSSGRVRVLREHKVEAVDVNGDRISGITLTNLKTGNRLSVACRVIIDATETGELLELAKVEHVLGAEAQATTGEPHALERADPLNQPAITWTFAADYLPDETHVIDKPASYEQWKGEVPKLWPGPRFSWSVPDHVTHQPRARPLFAGDSDEEYLFDLWHARRLAYRLNFAPGAYRSDITFACWPQNEYWDKPALGVPQSQADTALREAQELSLSFFYWMQTDAPRHDGKGTGYPGLRLRGDVLGTETGLAKQAYYREGRRIQAEFTLLEQHIGVAARPNFTAAETFPDSIGVAAYRIDLHYSTRGGDTVDIDTYPFQIPLGALLPVRVDNLLPACKNLGTTRITNGACRVHPAEWSIGEASGALAVFALAKGVPMRAVRSDPSLLQEFQQVLMKRGVMLAWPAFGPLTATARIGYRPPPAS
ncbi:MAG: FAD-dependent oxidoreductase [Methylobacteriaceae bacterium]|nr:FAD-dependent oxidoreductase [Methylobacteriaceae bacterium]